MFAPSTNPDPPFILTRASHIVLAVRDLAKSIFFYQEVIGLVVTETVGDIAFLRGLEEDSHHSLTLVRRDGDPECKRLGFRVRNEAEIDRAAAYFRKNGHDTKMVDVPFQGATLQVRDPQGLPIELCASMPTQPRLHNKTSLHRGGCALRFDHTQVQVSNVQSSYDFAVALGFMTSDYALAPSGELVSAFLRRKDNPHDIVLTSGRGPRLHHFAYITEKQNLLRTGDTAASLGFRTNVEFGPSRHGQDHASFLYLRDPEGHRIELLCHPIQIIDLDSKPVGRDVTNREQFLTWGQSPPPRYLGEASAFSDEPLLDPVVKRTW